MTATVLKSTNWRFSSLNHANFDFFGLGPKSPTHTGLIWVKTPEPNISSLGSFKGAQVWDFDVLDFNDFFHHKVYIGRGLEGWNKIFSFYTDEWDTGHYVLATACAVYASKLLPYAPSTLAKCYRMHRIRLQFAVVCAVYASKKHNFTRFCYRMRRVR